MSMEDESSQQKAVEYEWRLYPPPQPVTFHVGDRVFRRPKGAKEKGRVGQVVLGVEEGLISASSTTTPLQETNRIWMQEKKNDTSGSASGTKPMIVSRNRLVPIYHHLDDSPSTGSDDDGDGDDDEATEHETSSKRLPNKCRVIVTRETRSYRVLAASQLVFVSNEKDDHVLEIGCSNGECSRILARYAPSLVGMDVSTEMVAACRRRQSLICLEHHPSTHTNQYRKTACSNVRFEVMNVFLDPWRAIPLARRRRHRHNHDTSISIRPNNPTQQRPSQSQTNHDGHDSTITTTIDNTLAIHTNHDNDNDDKDAGNYKKRRTTWNTTESVEKEEQD
eukprot:scaffold86284_cov30-Attheya_sp.AAC.1